MVVGLLVVAHSEKFLYFENKRLSERAPMYRVTTENIVLDVRANWSVEFMGITYFFHWFVFTASVPGVKQIATI